MTLISARTAQIVLGLALALLSSTASLAGLAEPGKAAGGGQVKIDSAFPEYKAGPGVSGTIKSMGSDTMVNLMTHLGEEFQRFYPNVKIEVEGKGSSTAPPALQKGQAQFGAMSREMKAAEIDAFEKEFGYKPTGLRIALDTLAVYVHKDNPIRELSMEQIRMIFSVKGPEKVTWGDLGLTGDWADKPVSLYGRNSASGTYGFFKDQALKADFRPTVKEQPGSTGVVQGVATDRYAIGYAGIGSKTADVIAVAIKVDKDEPAVVPTPETALDGTYPLGRFLFVYVNAKPGQALDPLRAEFVKLMYSKQGQEMVVKDGYDPIPADLAREDLKKIGLTPGF